ncbi:MAG: hypothetical protein IPI67_05820 [Myxococcales bacterium]|nr:hypothetical protein [Myxococcales bacterium]
MNRALLLCAALAALACSRTEANPVASATPAPSTSAPAPAAGPLTLARLVAANEKVKKGDPWNAARETLIRELGPPTREAGFTDWGVTTADSCALLRLESNGDVVGVVSPAVNYSRASDLENFEDCYYRQDRTPPDKNPSASGPVAGKTYSVHELRAGLEEARSKWASQKIRLRGRVRGVVRSGATKDSTLASMSVADEKNEAETVGVQVTHDVKSAPRDGQHPIIVAEGVVAKVGRSLDDARIVK